MKIDIRTLTREFYEEHPIPAHATAGAAGIDLRAAIYSPLLLRPGETELVPTGLVFEVPNLVAMLLVPRSGLGHKHGVVLGNLTGVIDPDYRGEVKVSLWNRSEGAYTVMPGERICQALFIPFFRVELNPVDALPETDRGEGGFGSTRG